MENPNYGMTYKVLYLSDETGICSFLRQIEKKVKCLFLTEDSNLYYIEDVVSFSEEIELSNKEYNFIKYLQENGIEYIEF